MKAYLLNYPLVGVNPAWQQHIAVTYQGVAIQGFYFHRVRLRNHGSRSVVGFPITITASPQAVIAWPLSIPQGALQNVSIPSPNQLVATVDFINPKESVDISFWALNDNAGSLVVVGRAPDVEFVVTSYSDLGDAGFQIGVKIHYFVFWFGTAVLVALLGYGAYVLTRYIFGTVAKYLAG